MFSRFLYVFLGFAIAAATSNEAAAKPIKVCFKAGNQKVFLEVGTGKERWHLFARAKACKGNAVFEIEAVRHKDRPPTLRQELSIRAANGNYLVSWDGHRPSGLRAISKKQPSKNPHVYTLHASHDRSSPNAPLTHGMRVNITHRSNKKLMINYIDWRFKKRWYAIIGHTEMFLDRANRKNTEKFRRNTPAFFYLHLAGGPTAKPKPVAKGKPLPWKTVRGAATDIGVGGGRGWVVGTDGAAWEWTGKAFAKRGGANITRIDVGPGGYPWTVGKKGEIQRFDGKKFNRLPGLGQDIGVGAEGHARVVGMKGLAWQWNGKTWVKKGGKNLIRIDAGPRGVAWAVDKAGAIFHSDGKKWFKIPGKARDIAVSADANVWIVGTEKATGGGAVYLWDGKRSNWILHKGGLTNVSVDAKGLPWGVNEKRKVFSHAKSGALAPKPRADPAKVAALKKKIASIKAELAKHEKETDALKKKLVALNRKGNKLKSDMKRDEAELKKLTGQ